MPWSGHQFEHYNHGLSGPEANHAARIANAILRRGEPEGIAIATANKYFQKHEDGGGIGGIAPTTETMSPLMQGMIQRYSAMPPDKLAQLAVMMGGSPQGQIIQRILAQKRVQPTQQQNRGGVTRAPGGMMPMGQAVPSWSRQQERSEVSGPGASGFLHGATPGRADQILTTAPAGAYVIPADVVSGLGEGNSLAGAKVMDRIIRSGPHGTPMPRGGGSRGLPHAPAPLPAAKGGEIEGPNQTPVALSHGEFVVEPHHVAHWGSGDMKLGHKIFDDFVVKMREHIIGQMKKLPGPVRSKAA